MINQATRVAIGDKQEHLAREESTHQPCKIDAIADILKRSEVLALNVEVHLFVHLMMAGGCVTGTNDQIGEDCGTSGRNINGWLKKLHGGGMVAVKEMEHRQKTIELKEPYLSVAQMDDTPPLQRESQMPKDPELERIITAYNTAKQTGQEMVVNTNMVIRHD